MPGFQIQFEAVDEASPTIQKLSQMMLDAAQKGDKFASDLYNSSERINTSLKKISPVAKETSDSFSTLKQAGSDLTSQLLGIASIGGLTVFFKQSAEQALQQEEALRRLGFAVDAAGGSFASSKGQIMAFAEEQQNATQFSQTQTLEAMGRLVRVTGDVGQAMQATRLVFGLASASGRDFNSIMDMLAPILQGDSSRIRALQSDFGSFIGNASNAQEVIDNLSKKFLGAAEKQDGFGKELSSLKNRLDDFKQTVGAGVLPAFQLFLEAVLKGAEYFEKFGVVIANWAAHAMLNVKDLAEFMKEVFTLNFSGTEARHKQFAAQYQAIEEESQKQAAEIQKRYSGERVQSEQEEARLKAGVRRKTQEELEREAEERKKLEEDAHDFINKLDAELLKDQKKNLDSKLKLIENEKEDRIQKLEEYHQKGILTEEQLRAATVETAEIAKLKSKETREELDKDFQAEKEGAKKVGEAFASNIGSALADVIVEGKSMQEAFDAAFKQILKTAIETFTRIAIESAVLRGSTDGIGMLGGLIAVGGFASGAFKGVHLAEGGIVRKPTIAQIGEGGPEAVIPLDKLGSAAGPSIGDVRVSVTQNNTISIQGVDDDQVREVMRRIAQATRNGAAEGAELVKSILAKESRFTKEAV
jgi:ABC-type transporter Mla subunit MlaD